MGEGPGEMWWEEVQGEMVVGGGPEEMVMGRGSGGDGGRRRSRGNSSLGNFGCVICQPDFR